MTRYIFQTGGGQLPLQTSLRRPVPRVRPGAAVELPHRRKTRRRRTGQAADAEAGAEKCLSLVSNTIKLFFSFPMKRPNQAATFVPGKLFQPGLKCPSKPGACIIKHVASNKLSWILNRVRRKLEKMAIFSKSSPNNGQNICNKA